MTDSRALAGASLSAAVLMLAMAGPLAAQDAGSTAERTRRAFATAGEPDAAPHAARQAEAEAAAEQAAAQLGVELLSTRLLETSGGRRLIAARVMEPGGDSNVAFLVQTLVVDPESGDVLGVFPGTDDEISALPALAAEAPVPDDQPETGSTE